MTKQERFDRNFLRVAWTTALSLSKDPLTQVGAVIVSEDSRQVSLGYNGFSAGVAEPESRWARPEKYSWVIHAEMNAVMNTPFDTKGCTLYCTHQPCHRCIVHLVNTGIKKIVYYTPKSDERPDIFQEISMLFDQVYCIDYDEVVENLKSMYQVDPVRFVGKISREKNI